jgi:outer membrane receptor protein involved in Fe transport
VRAIDALAQYTPLDSIKPPASLAKLVSLSLSRASLREAIAGVAREAGVSIAFDPTLAGLDRSVTVKADRVTAARVLLRLLDGSEVQAMTTADGSIVLTARPQSEERRTFVTGVVRQPDGPLAGVHLWLTGTRFEAMTDRAGRFSFGSVPAGLYSLRALRMGFAPIVRALRVGAPSDAGSVELQMIPAAVPVDAVIVTPGYFGVMQPSIANGQTLTRQQIETVPQLGEDVYRTIGRLPGVASDDYSAKFNVRGESADELFVTLDGLPLVEPYHLKDLGNSLSIVDLASLGQAELITGGPSSEFGNQLAGVFKLHSVEPRTDRVRTSTGISLTNVRAMSQGGFAGGRGSWLISGRRGFLDLAFKLAHLADSLSPRYNDVFGKASYDIGRGGRVALHALHAGDRLKYLTTGEPSIESDYRSDYLWATVESRLGRTLRQESVAWLGSLDWRRDGDETAVRNDPSVLIRDVRGMHTVGVRQDWSAEMGEHALFKFGADVRHERANYDYSRVFKPLVSNGTAVMRATDSIAQTVGASSEMVGAYVSQRVRPFDALTFEAGVRYDHASHTNETIVSPRFNASWQPTSTTTIRGAWGKHAQSQSVFGLQVEDGLQAFQPAERANQRGIGIDQVTWNGIALRAEAYDREISHLRARYVNASMEVYPFAEIHYALSYIAPTRARSRGIELSVEREGGRRMDWSASYVISSSRQELNGKWIPRPTDQPRAVRGDWSIHPTNNRWRLSLSAVRHTGWPFTPQRLDIDTIGFGTASPYLWVTRMTGDLYSERAAAYQRVDGRWTQFIDTHSGRIALFVDVYNLLNNSNMRETYNDIFISQRLTVTYLGRAKMSLPRIPSFGINWEF